MPASMQYEVFCHICGRRYPEGDPAVRALPGEGVWECASEPACLERRAFAEYLQPGRRYAPVPVRRWRG